MSQLSAADIQKRLLLIGNAAKARNPTGFVDERALAGDAADARAARATATLARLARTGPLVDAVCRRLVRDGADVGAALFAGDGEPASSRFSGCVVWLARGAERLRGRGRAVARLRGRGRARRPPPTLRRRGRRGAGAARSARGVGALAGDGGDNITAAGGDGEAARRDLRRGAESAGSSRRSSARAGRAQRGRMVPPRATLRAPPPSTRRSRSAAVAARAAAARVAELEDALAAAAAEARTRDARSLAAAAERLSVDLYEHRDHFLHELFQNADDARHDGVDAPALEVGLSGSWFFASSNQRPGFDAADVRAICDVNASTKAGDAATTGHKGIGFKAVFAMCDRPCVLSNGFAFYFDGARALGLRRGRGAFAAAVASSDELRGRALDYLGSEDRAEPPFWAALRADVAARLADVACCRCDDGSSRRQRRSSATGGRLVAPRGRRAPGARRARPRAPPRARRDGRGAALRARRPRRLGRRRRRGREGGAAAATRSGPRSSTRSRSSGRGSAHYESSPRTAAARSARSPTVCGPSTAPASRRGNGRVYRAAPGGGAARRRLLERLGVRAALSYADAVDFALDAAAAAAAAAGRRSTSSGAWATTRTSPRCLADGRASTLRVPAAAGRAAPAASLVSATFFGARVLLPDGAAARSPLLGGGAAAAALPDERAISTTAAEPPPTAPAVEWEAHLDRLGVAR
ncbi:hypothetical protein JL720_14399 [Aureococcus anophagefferens]|nr:hypothetical protein JL720_14399 [Aureococcus anophagefferens]